MKTVRLIVLGREGSRQSYGTRRLIAGDEFEERRDVADLLVRTGRAKLAPEPGREDPPASPTVQEPAAEPDPPPVSHETPSPEPAEHRNSIDDLREEAEALGIDVDGRWGVVRLQAEIARAKRR